jgi:hypothetical protein
MAQSIALQRGEVTMVHNTSTLLFTNGSSGTATRLVVGYLSYTSNFSTVYGYCTFAVLRNGAASPNFSIIAATYPGNVSRTVAFSPHDTANGWHGQATGTFEYSPVLENPDAGIIGARCLSASSPLPSRAFYNPNVMLGPSDGVFCGWFDNGGGSRSAVVQYCFTLITES